MEQSQLNELLKGAKESKILDFKAQDLSEKNIQRIAESIPEIEGLMVIDFSDSSMKPNIPKYLFDAIKKCKSLLHLDMSWCKLTDQDAKYFSAAIIKHPSLLSLNLTESGISSNGAKAFADVLKDNDELLSIDLYGNNLGFTGGNKIAEAVEYNKRLLCLRVGNSGIGVEAEEKIYDKIHENLKFLEENVIKKGGFNLTTLIPTLLTKYLENLTSSFVERPLELEDNPIVFIGQWQSEQQRHNEVLINLSEQSVNTLLLYKESKDKMNETIQIVQSQARTKENLTQNRVIIQTI